MKTLVALARLPFPQSLFDTLSDAPGDKQAGATLSLPPPMGSHRLLAGFD